MIYRDGDILIRDMCASDPAYFAAEERRQGWHADERKLNEALRDAGDGLAVALTAELGGVPAGYARVYCRGKDGPFARLGYPEIVDINVLEKFRRRGVGAALMDAAEAVAASLSDTVYLAVGLHSGYGSAQRMYARRGYIPDGTGAWYGDAVCEPYAACANDDDLVIYLSKKLK